MVERIKVVVRASGAHPDILTVQDAMRQVLDFFDTIERIPGVEWKLARATTNSPLSVEGEAVSLEAGVDVTVIARAQKQALARNWRAVASGKIPDDPAFNIKIAKRFLARTMNGIGATEIDFEVGPSVTVTPEIAKEAIKAIDTKPGTLFEPTPAREEVGTVEGTLQGVGTYYGFPAVRILETRTRNYIWVRLSDDLQPIFQDKASYQDVWHINVSLVRGRIRYNSESEISSVVAADIRRIDPRPVSLDEIKDQNFTGGLSIGDYLDRFRDGNLADTPRYYWDACAWIALIQQEQDRFD